MPICVPRPLTVMDRILAAQKSSDIIFEHDPSCTHWCNIMWVKHNRDKQYITAAPGFARLAKSPKFQSTAADCSAVCTQFIHSLWSKKLYIRALFTW